jgi:hypothetical protein
MRTREKLAEAVKRLKEQQAAAKRIAEQARKEREKKEQEGTE